MLKTYKRSNLRCGVGALWPYPEPRIHRFVPAGCINLHPSLLPYNAALSQRGSIIDGTPAGGLCIISMRHRYGDIVAQRRSRERYRYRKRCIVVSNSRHWICSPKPGLWCAPARRRAGRKRGRRYAPSFARCRSHDEIDLAATYTAKQLIDLLRARTFPPIRVPISAAVTQDLSPFELAYGARKALGK